MDDWMGILFSKMITMDNCEDVFNEFSALRTDEERVTFILKLMLQYNMIPKVYTDRKNAEISTEFRKQGNEKFVSNPLTSSLCIDVLKLYTKSIAHAPYLSEQLALAYANRSAVLRKLHKYQECIQDVDSALALPYPNNLKNKLYQRKIECLSILKHPKIEDAIKEAQCWLEKMSLDDVRYKKINDTFISAKRISDTPKKQSIVKQTLLPKIKSHNTEVPCASDAVTIKYNEQYGRHIVATRNINPGEIIAIEKPYSVMLIPDNLQTHCSNCLEICWANIPCNYCTYSMYCSEECKALHWERYHDIECAVFPSLLKMKFEKIHLFSLKLAIQAVRENRNIQSIREELTEVENHNDPRTKGFSKNGTFESNSYRSVLSLVTNIEKLSVQTCFRRALEATVMLYYLATCSNMFGSSIKDLSELIKNTDVTFVGGLLIRHQLLIEANAHTLSEEREIDAVDRGWAVLPFLSLTNHCCNANILRNSRSMDTVVYVLHPIKKDEQIFDEYGQHFALVPKAIRQRELLKQYHFVCNCLACQEDWPLYHELNSRRDWTKSKEDMIKIDDVLTKYETYHAKAMQGDAFDQHMIDDLVEMIQVIYELVSLPCVVLSNVVEILKRVYCLNGNRFVIPKL